MPGIIEIVPKKDRSHSGDGSKDANASQTSKLEKALSEKDNEIAALKAEIDEISKKYRSLVNSVGKIRRILDLELTDIDDE